jgi:hypothetical protein
LGIGKTGFGGFTTNALGGNAFSGATDLVESLATGQSGSGEDVHSVFYNMGQGLVAGPTQGFGAPFSGRLRERLGLLAQRTWRLGR